jgi:hypothetical protein
MEIRTNNRNYSNKNFKMAMKIHQNAGDVIKNRLKTAKELKQLNELIDKASQNKFIDIQLFGDKNVLSANIHSKELYNRNNARFFQLRSKEENFIDLLLKSPIRFIKRVVEFADKEAKKLEKIVPENLVQDTINKAI